MVNGITFSEQLITSANFAHFMHTFLNRANGVTKGCEIGHSNGNIYVQKGYFMEFGRMVQVVGVEEITSPDVLSGQLYCKVVFEIDLSKMNTADAFNQGYFKTLTSVTGYPTVTQEDLDNDGILYQMPWCQYIKKTDDISEFRDLREILNLVSVWSSISGQNSRYKNEFDTYFAAQSSVIERMIAELEAQGFLKLVDAKRVLSVRLLKSGWTGSAAPYTQTVNVSGITADMEPILVSNLADGATEAVQKAYAKAFGIVSSGTATTGNGTATFKVYKKPEIDISVGLKGV